ncbi:MAG: ATP-binding protein [Aquisalimonadaceae bacterium]
MIRIDLTTLFVSAVLYLLLLFLIAYATDRRWLPGWLIRHPAVSVLSLGVYATSWSYYGSVGFAQQQGFLFITTYLGLTLAFVLTPVLLMPILRLTRTYQLTSVADLFAFRFNSQAVGVLVTLLMLAGVLPYIALQIRAVAESTVVLTQDSSPQALAFWFVVLVSVFTIIFGARHVSPREKHEGMVVAIAFESLMKLFALLVVAAIAVYQAFGGLGGMQTWLEQNPEHLQALYEPVREGPWASLLVLAFAAGFLLPRQFHMLFTENIKPRHLYTASWAFPLYLLALTLVIPPILWAAQVLQPGTSPDYHVLGLSQLSGSPALVVLAYLGGISAASAMVVVSTLAISSMTLNHLVLPLIRPQPHRDLYDALRWARRTMIAAIIAAGYGFYMIMEPTSGLVGWGLISFLAMAQMLPGVVGLLFWPRATASGFIAGLIGGTAIWTTTALLPPLTGTSTMVWLGLAAPGAAASPAVYQSATFWSLSANVLLFVLVSLLSRPDEREREAAAVCRELTPVMPLGRLRAGSPAQFVEKLTSVMGEKAARAEVEKALRELDMRWDESRPGNLYGLRNQIQRNLSGMMGPVLARMIVDARLELDRESRTALAQNVRLIEERLETSRTRLRGLAAELDRLRRYHRQIIEDLPVGVCAIAQGGRLVRWNPAIQRLTGMPMAEIIGRRVDELPPPWGPLLVDFMDSRADHWHKQEVQRYGRSRWYSLHKAAIEEPGRGRSGDTVLLIEDLTEMQLLEQELTHSERLASIGRLAAGVAHEIGNPVTGISCLAQELREETDPALIAGHADDILQQAQRINNIVQSLVRYAHGGSTGQRVMLPVNLHETVAEATRLTMLSRRARQLAFENRIPVNLHTLADSQQMVQVFVNLFTNAADACAQDGRVVVSARRRGEWLEIVIEDNGCGIPADVQNRVLEPFFTTKQPGQGTGLGLPLVYNIIRDCGGQLDITSNDSGTAVTLRLQPADTPLTEEV